MAEIIRKTFTGYQYVFDYLTDPRTKSWPLVAKPYEGIAVLTLYLLFVLKWGPKWMRHRQPFNLDKIMIVYNALQVVLCGYLFIFSLKEAWLWKYKLFCEPVDFTESEHAKKIARLVYCYYLLKYLDLVDTIFFVLRKKFKQISFLHVYHHTGMVMLIWGGITYYPGGHGTGVGVINSFVHVVMYSYYLLTVAVPSVKKSMWWKKYVTQLQIVQFFLCVVHMGAITFMSDCGYPRWIVAIFLPQNLFMLILFVDFYIKTYIRKPEKKVTMDKKGEDTDNLKSKFDDDAKLSNGVQKILKDNHKICDGISLRNLNRS